MIVGVPKEIKTNENRIAVVPAGVEILTQNGLQVLIEKDGDRKSTRLNSSHYS